MEVAISANDLEIGYKAANGNISVSKITSLDLERGKLTCLLGSNGVGKSTLLKSLTGNLTLIAGSIAIDGEPMQELTEKERAKKLAVVLTDKAHLGFTTVSEMITLGRNPYTNWMNSLGVKDAKAINHALHSIGMTELAHKPLSELSDGNLQKVIIGRAIAQETDIIILDEPTVHLDITNKTIIVELLRKLCREDDKTILFSTHDLELAKLYADNLWIMNEEKLIQDMTENLILDGTLEKSFHYESTVNDLIMDSVIIHGSPHDAEILIRGLMKSGLANDLKAEITISKNLGKLQIEVDGKTFEDIRDLISYLGSPN